LVNLDNEIFLEESSGLKDIKINIYGPSAICMNLHSIDSRDEIKPVQAIKILQKLKKVERVENFEKKKP
jgi:hypothetical protein